jgi:3-phenylpropionate/trans-cinnamate dioxygenase ferredoxin subunit
MRFVAAAALSELPEGRPAPLELEGERIVLVRRGEQVFALADRCSHEDAPLHDGIVDGDRIECARHGACFELGTGRALTLPASEGIWVYPVRVVAGRVEVGLETSEAAGAA